MRIRAREAAAASERGSDLFTAVFKDAAIGIALVDMDGRPIRCNPALERMLGYEAEELSRMVFTDFTHPDDAAADWAMFEELVRGERDSYRMEKRYFRKDGREIWGHLTVSLTRDRSGRPGYVIGMVEDITERKRVEHQLREAEERYRDLVEQLPVVVYVNALTETDEALYVSPAYERMFGYTPQERLADPELWHKRLHPDDREWVLAEAARVERTGEPFRVEYRYIHKDGRIVWVREEGVLVRDEHGVPRYWQGVLLDVTERKEAEARLVETREHLRRSDEQRLAILSRLFNAQEDERRRLASDIHDDTVQKLTAVALRLATLRRDRPDLGTDGQFDRLQTTVEEATRRLRSLVFELRPPALDAGLVTAVQSFVAEQRKLQTGPEYSIVSELSREPSEQVRIVVYRLIREAITNARKHAEASDVTIALTERDGGVLARVTDDGVGFDPSDRRDGAAGHLGLTDMRERVELAGGWMLIRSSAGRGTVVEAWLPDV